MHCDTLLFVFIYGIIFLLVRCSLKNQKVVFMKFDRVPESFYDYVRTVVAYTIKCVPTSLYVCSVLQAM